MNGNRLSSPLRRWNQSSETGLLDPDALCLKAVFITGPELLRMEAPASGPYGCRSNRAVEKHSNIASHGSSGLLVKKPFKRRHGVSLGAHGERMVKRLSL